MLRLGPLLVTWSCGGDETAAPCPAAPEPGPVPFVDAGLAFGVDGEVEVEFGVGEVAGLGVLEEDLELRVGAECFGLVHGRRGFSSLGRGLGDRGGHQQT